MEQKNFLMARMGIVAFAFFGMCTSQSRSIANEVSGLAIADEFAQASAGPHHLTLALKFVEFTRNGIPVMSVDQLKPAVHQMNTLFMQCGMRLRVEEVQQVDPTHYGLSFNVSAVSAMNSIRAPFDADNALVVVNTGSWDHNLMGPANAWTAMPGSNPSGAVLEASVADNGNILAHELGHYLNLDHANDSANLMNPIIYNDSTVITRAQCEQMRRTARTVRARAIRAS